MSKGPDSAPTPDALMAQLAFFASPLADFNTSKPARKRTISVYHGTSKEGFYGLLPYVLPDDNNSNGVPFYTCVYQKSQILRSENASTTFSLPGAIEAICGTANDGLKAEAIVNSQDSVSVQLAGQSLEGSRLLLQVAPDSSSAPTFHTTATKFITPEDTWQIEAPTTFKLGPKIDPIFIGYAMQSPKDKRRKVPLVICQAVPGNIYTLHRPRGWIVAFWESKGEISTGQIVDISTLMKSDPIIFESDGTSNASVYHGPGPNQFEVEYGEA
ncbi:hypothetical protein DM02DRAFT_733222 [Periconia macrospinosa]|uniref:Uncharacterized protein n=1 Tax=Periconia macrospinosa TaxID=97972 RepID=A0A2V1D5E8_9PLEO|nr:hypothetical protein DM02DRAFT_733222 [Periconia macrospinosa]